MINQINDIIGLGIFDPTENISLGRIKKVIIDPDNGKILAFLRADNLAAPAQEVYFDETGQLCSRHKNLWAPLSEILRAEEVHKSKIGLSKQRVISENRSDLGKLYDMQFDSTNFVVTNLITRKKIWFFNRFFVIPTKNIIEVTPKIITVTDNNAYAIIGKLGRKMSVVNC